MPEARNQLELLTLQNDVNVLGFENQEFLSKYAKDDITFMSTVNKIEILISKNPQYLLLIGRNMYSLRKFLTENMVRCDDRTKEKIATICSEIYRIISNGNILKNQEQVLIRYKRLLGISQNKDISFSDIVANNLETLTILMKNSTKDVPTAFEDCVLAMYKSEFASFYRSEKFLDAFRYFMREIPEFCCMGTIPQRVETIARDSIIWNKYKPDFDSDGYSRKAKRVIGQLKSKKGKNPEKCYKKSG